MHLLKTVVMKDQSNVHVNNIIDKPLNDKAPGLDSYHNSLCENRRD